MSGAKVDVLAVIDAEIQGIKNRVGSGKRLDNLIESRAAVAELIEAAKDVIDSTVTAHGYPDGPCIDRTERERLIAALSNIGPQS